MLIKQTDYHRIYRVINSLLINENADPATASMYFSTFGAFILEHHYKVKAKPKPNTSVPVRRSRRRKHRSTTRPLPKSVMGTL